jgi:L-rhamnose isomerase
MDGFDVYKIYLAIKLHFTSDSYDYFKHNGKTTARLNTFTKRRDRYFFHKLSRSYSSSACVDYFVAGFIGSDTVWIGDVVGKSGQDNYTKWQKRIESLSYVFENDCDTLLDFIEEKEIKFDDLFKVKKGQHPPLVKLYLANKITVESMVILNDILNYTKQFNKEIGETVIWPKKYKLLMNYKPFLKYNSTKMKMIIKKKINER